MEKINFKEVLIFTRNKNIVTNKPYKVTIVADGNDADYVSSTVRYYKNDFENIYLPFIAELHLNNSGKNKLEYVNSYLIEILSLPLLDKFCTRKSYTLEDIVIEYYDVNGVYSVNFKIDKSNLWKYKLNAFIYLIEKKKKSIKWIISCGDYGLEYKFEDLLKMSKEDIIKKCEEYDIEIILGLIDYYNTKLNKK